MTDEEILAEIAAEPNGDCPRFLSQQCAVINLRGSLQASVLLQFLV